MISRHLRIKRGALYFVIGVVGFAGLAVAAVTFNFHYVTTYGTNGLSQPYAGVTTSNQSYPLGVAISHSDTNQSPYSLVSANPDTGSGYQGPYYIVRRLSNGNIDTGFGQNGYVNSFPLSANTNYQFRDICVDPGTGNMIVIGQTYVSSGTGPGIGEIVVERLVPPSSGTGSATLDQTFNALSTTPGEVVITSTLTGNGNPYPNRCLVTNKGAGNDGTIYVAGNDDVYPSNCTTNCSPTSGLLLAAKIKGDGTLDSSFGAGGVTEVAVSDGSTVLVPDISDIALNGNQSTFPNLIISGDGYPPGQDTQGRAAILAINRCTGALDTSFNSTGELVNPNYSPVPSQAVLGAISDDGADAATGLNMLFVNTTNFSGVFAQYAISGGVANTTSPTTQSGTITFPSSFAPQGGAAINSSGQGVVSGSTSANAEVLAEIGGSSVLGYTPTSTPDTFSCSGSSSGGSSSGGSSSGGSSSSGSSSGGSSSGGSSGGGGFDLLALSTLGLLVGWRRRGSGRPH